jgi:hypothetical protein
MGKIHDRFKAKAFKGQKNSVARISHGVINDKKSASAAYSTIEPVLDKSKFNLKYVVSYNDAKQTFHVDTTKDWLNHSDCHVPVGARIVSAGWVSIPLEEYRDYNYNNAVTWGRSIGFQLETHPRDLEMLQAFLINGQNSFDRATHGSV